MVKSKLVFQNYASPKWQSGFQRKKPIDGHCEEQQPLHTQPLLEPSLMPLMDLIQQWLCYISCSNNKPIDESLWGSAATPYTAFVGNKFDDFDRSENDCPNKHLLVNYYAEKMKQF